MYLGTENLFPNFRWTFALIQMCPSIGGNRLAHSSSEFLDMLEKETTWNQIDKNQEYRYYTNFGTGMK